MALHSDLRLLYRFSIDSWTASPMPSEKRNDRMAGFLSHSFSRIESVFPGSRGPIGSRQPVYLIPRFSPTASIATIPAMLGRVGTLLEMINSPIIAVLTSLGRFQRIDAIDVIDLGRF